MRSLSHWSKSNFRMDRAAAKVKSPRLGSRIRAMMATSQFGIFKVVGIGSLPFNGGILSNYILVLKWSLGTTEIHTEIPREFCWRIACYQVTLHGRSMSREPSLQGVHRMRHGFFFAAALLLIAGLTYAD